MIWLRWLLLRSGFSHGCVNLVSWIELGAQAKPNVYLVLLDVISESLELAKSYYVGWTQGVEYF